jgi:hypothetical protein
VLYFGRSLYKTVPRLVEHERDSQRLRIRQSERIELSARFKESDEFYSAVAKTTDEANKLIEAGFDYICTTPGQLMIFRKRK